jgi:hypothetical protein
MAPVSAVPAVVVDPTLYQISVILAPWRLGGSQTSDIERLVMPSIASVKPMKIGVIGCGDIARKAYIPRDRGLRRP